jgi:hypothetical protein
VRIDTGKALRTFATDLEISAQQVAD